MPKSNKFLANHIGKIFLLFLCLMILVSIIMWIHTKQFIHGCWHWFAVYGLEYGSRIQQGRFTPPLVNSAYWLFKRWSAKKIIHHTIKTTFKVNRLSEWKVIHMLDCGEGDFSSIGEGEKSKLIEQYNKLMFQYMDAEGDFIVDADRSLRITDMTLKSMQFQVMANVAMLKKMYNSASAKFLREDIHKLIRGIGYNQPFYSYPFSRDTYLSDLGKVESWLIALQIAIDRNDNAIAKIQAKEEVKTLTREQKESQMQDTIMQINSLLKTGYQLHSMYVSELASGKKALKKEYKRQEDAIKRNKGGR